MILYSNMVETGEIMKKHLLFVIISLLLVCSIACNSPKIKENICSDDYADIKEETLPAQLNTTTLNTTFSEVTNVDVTADVKISYEDIVKETENYFRFFFSNNHDFSCSYIDTKTERGTNGSYIIGYFYDNSIVTMTSEIYGESKSNFITYFFVNPHLTYIIERVNYQWPLPREESYQEYFLVDEELLQYNDETCELIKSDNLYLADYFEQDKQEFLGDKKLSYIENDCKISMDNNKLAHFNELKRLCFKKFFTGEKFEIYGDYFHVDMPNFYNYYHLNYFEPQNDINALYIDSKLFLLRIAEFDDSLYTGYEYFIVDESKVYVVIYKQEFENKEINYNKMKISCYEEYFIVDEKVLKYDSCECDLVEASDNTEILNIFNSARERAKTEIS